MIIKINNRIKVHLRVGIVLIIMIQIIIIPVVEILYILNKEKQIILI
jgi:hypothetical protein